MEEGNEEEGGKGGEEGGKSWPEARGAPVPNRKIGHTALCDVGYLRLRIQNVRALSLMRAVPEHTQPSHHPHDQPDSTRLSPCILSTGKVLFAK